MKNGIKKGLCFLLLCLTILILLWPVIAAAKSGHGGTTQVIATIEAPSDGQSEQPCPESSVPVSSDKTPSVPDDQPVGTGDAVPWLLLTAAVVSLALVIVIKTDSKEKTE